MADDALKTQLAVIVGKDTFEFKIPGLHEEVRIGSRMNALRQKIDPEWDGVTPLDFNTVSVLRACAVFETLLLRSSVEWVFSPGPQGKPIVDSSRFPPEKAREVVEAYEGYSEQLRTFREEGAADKPLPPAKAVEGQSNPG